MKIIRLEAENVKRLRAVTIDPSGALVVLGGRNGAGKSSVLDSISAAIGGAEMCPAVPIRKGEKSAKVTVTLDENLIITRTWTEGGSSYLTVANREGARYTSPQAILDRLVGRLTFDPLQFLNEKPANQAETLRQLCGLDFTALDADRQKRYDERRDFAREMKQKQGAVASMPSHGTLPAGEMDVNDLTARVEAAEAWRNEGDEMGQALVSTKRKCQDLKGDVERITAEINRLHKTLEQCTGELKDQTSKAVAMAAKIDERRPPEGYIAPADLRAEIDRVLEHNRKVAQNARKREAENELAQMVIRHDEMDAAIEKIDAEKRAMLSQAKYPVEGLALGGDGVTLNELPFEQASQAEQLRVSVAMGLALNPKLRVLLVRDGSLLDEDNLRLIAEMAAANDSQIWLERVGNGAEVSVLIEDGAVVERKAEDAA